MAAWSRRVAEEHANGDSDLEVIGDAIEAADEAENCPGPGDDADLDLAFVQDVLTSLRLPDRFAQRSANLLQHARQEKKLKRLAQIVAAGVPEDVKDCIRRHNKEFVVRTTYLIRPKTALVMPGRGRTTFVYGAPLASMGGLLR